MVPLDTPLNMVNLMVLLALSMSLRSMSQESIPGPDAITGLVSKYHTETGRPHRLIVAVHPSITDDADPPAKEHQP